MAKREQGKLSKPMNAATMTNTNFSLKKPARNSPMQGAVACDEQGNAATFTPQASLAPDTSYTATITNGVIDVPGTSLGESGGEWSAEAEVTVINGDVALYPNPTCMDSTGNNGASQTCLVKTYAGTTGMTDTTGMTGMTVNGSIAARPSRTSITVP